MGDRTTIRLETTVLSYRPGGGKNRFLAALTVLSDGISEAAGRFIARNWKLLGALGYYAFDNAALWAAFHAYGRNTANQRRCHGLSRGITGCGAYPAAPVSAR